MPEIYIPQTEVLRNLGYKNQEIDANIENLLKETIFEISSKAKPRCTYSKYSIIRTENYITLSENNLTLYGSSIQKHLSDCKKCFLVAATLGSDIDKWINFLSVNNLTKSIIADACATTMIENFCNTIENKLSKYILNSEERLVCRYSPGYGDLPIEIQSNFLSSLDAGKKIGLHCTSEYILIPQKSVTFISGITESKIDFTSDKCLKCNRNSDCLYKMSKDKGECSE